MKPELLYVFLVLAGGFVAGLNAALMFPSELYQTGWWKIVFALCLAALGALPILGGGSEDTRGEI